MTIIKYSIKLTNKQKRSDSRTHVHFRYVCSVDKRLHIFKNYTNFFKF